MHDNPPRAVGRRRLRLGFALLGVVALVLVVGAVGAGLARAAPSLSASENPVVIGSGQSSKTISVSWNLDGFLWATLTIRDNAQTVVGQHAAFTPTGSVPLTVSCGKSYTATLADAANPRSVLASLAITVQCGPLTIDPGVINPCVVVACHTVTVTPEPHGTWAAFTVTPDAPAMMLLEVSTKPPNAKSEWSNPADVMSSTATILPTQQWTAQVMDLAPSTTLFYAVHATFSDGQAVKTGSFTTLKRFVTVTYTSIAINDDSDGFGAGACDCDFWLFVSSVQIGHVSGDFDSGDTVTLNGVTVTNTPAPATWTIGLKVVGNDDDANLGQFCPYGVPPSGSGSNDCHDWATVQWSIPLPAGTDEVVPATPFSFLNPVGALRFTVHGTYKVEYKAP